MRIGSTHRRSRLLPSQKDVRVAIGLRVIEWQHGTATPIRCESRVDAPGEVILSPTIWRPSHAGQQLGESRFFELWCDAHSLVSHRGSERLAVLVEEDHVDITQLGTLLIACGPREKPPRLSMARMMSRSYG